MKTKTIISRLNQAALKDVRKIAKTEPKTASILLPKMATIATSAINYLETGNTFSYAKCFLWYKERAGDYLTKIMEKPDKYVDASEIRLWDDLLVRIATGK